MNPIAIRLLNQQLASPIFDNPVEVISHMGAIQAQEYRLMRWAVAMRTKKPSAEAFRKAYDSGKIIRMHLLRGTWQLITASDYGWMLKLCAPKGIAITKGWMTAQGVSITEEERYTVSEILEQTVANGGSVTKDDFVQALTDKNIHMDDCRLIFHLRMAEMNGLLCSGNLHPMKPTYSLVSQKIKNTSHFEHDEALALLARKYFSSHSPATLEDFVWWSGLNIGECRLGIKLIKSELHIESWQGRVFYIHDSCRTKGVRKGHTLLLPSYDEYLISYKSRDIVLPSEFRHKAHNNSGIFYPVITYDGTVCGNWKPFSKNNDANFFTGTPEFVNVDKEWKKYRKTFPLL